MKRADIEGLRALSIGLVFAFHLFPAALPGGFIGVDVFFVISGFLITQHLFTEYHTTGRIKPLAFYARRIRRLLPASFLVLLVSLALTAFILPASNTQKFADGITASAFYVANWFLALTSTGYNQIGADPSIIQQYWSLSVEEQFYLIWPLLFIIAGLIATALIKKSGRAKTIFLSVLSIVFIASLVTSILQTRALPEQAFYSTFTRAWEFALGGLIAFAPTGARLATTRARRVALITLAWLAFAIIIATSFLFTDAMPYPGWRALIPVAAAALLILIGDLDTNHEPAYLTKFSPVLAIGALSYSIYLWHWPVIITAAHYRGTTMTLPRAALIIAITLALAIATKYAIENPLRFGPALRTPLRAILFAAIGELIITALAIAATWRANTLTAQAETNHTTPFTNTQQINNAIHTQINTNTWTGITQFTPRKGSSIAGKFGCYAVHDEPGIKRCTFGPKNSNHLMVVIGDSFADMYAAGIIAGFANTDWRILPITNSQCPAADFHRSNSQIKAELSSCEAFQEWRHQEIVKLKPEAIVVAHNSSIYFNGEKPTGQSWTAGLTSFLSKIESITQNIVVVGEAPWITSCSVSEAPSSCSSINPDWSTYNSEKRAVNDAGFDFIDTRRWYCDETLTICPEAIDGTYVHRALNDPHISDEYSLRLSHLLYESISAGIVQ